MSHPRDTSMLHSGDTLDGRYLLTDRIGSGGMGRVFRARDTVLERDVAVKLFHTDRMDDPDAARRLSEARVLAALAHPSLVTLYDARLDADDHVYLVMELIDGPSLQRRIEAGPLTPALVAGLLTDLARALAAVHATGIVHRDIKPSNVLLRPVGVAAHSYEAVLADFGVAHLIDATRLTTPGTVIGTAAYLAPEQVRGEPPQPASDIYALGLLTLEALTRLHPYGGGSLQETVLARLARQPEIPGELGYHWKALLTSMTAFDPGARPTAADVATRAEALAAVQDVADDGADVSPATMAETAPWMLPPTTPAGVSQGTRESDVADGTDRISRAAPEIAAMGPRRSASDPDTAFARRGRRWAWGGAAAAAAAAVIVGGHFLVASTPSPAAPVTEIGPSPSATTTPSPAEQQAAPVTAVEPASDAEPAETSVESPRDAVSPTDDGTAPVGTGQTGTEADADPVPPSVPDAPPEPAPGNGNGNGNDNGNGKRPGAGDAPGKSDSRGDKEQGAAGGAGRK